MLLKKYLMLFLILLYSGCSYKESDFTPKDPKDSVFYDLSEDGKHEALKNKYGKEWRDKL